MAIIQRPSGWWSPDHAVEADADAVLFGAVHGNLVAEPAFPQHEGSGLGGAAFINAGLAGRGRHHHGMPGVFEDNGARAFRRCHIIGAAQYGVGVDVGGVGSALRQDIDPQAIAEGLAALQFPFERFGECGGVGVDDFLESGEGF